jgi:hypothetical protein
MRVRILSNRSSFLFLHDPDGPRLARLIAVVYWPQGQNCFCPLGRSARFDYKPSPPLRVRSDGSFVIDVKVAEFERVYRWCRIAPCSSPRPGLEVQTENAGVYDGDHGSLSVLGVSRRENFRGIPTAARNGQSNIIGRTQNRYPGNVTTSPRPVAQHEIRNPSIFVYVHCEIWILHHHHYARIGADDEIVSNSCSDSIDRYNGSISTHDIFGLAERAAAEISLKGGKSSSRRDRLTRCN